MSSKKRKYHESYVSFGFTSVTNEDGSESPQCFLCGKVLSNGYLKPSKLKQHLHSVHPQHASGSVDDMKVSKNAFESAKTVEKRETPKKALLEASYKVAYFIAKEKKPHTIAESLIKPCALEMVELVIGPSERKEIEKIPLSNSVIKSRVADISDNILKQVLLELTNSPAKFSLQLDESTDVSQCAHLIVFVRYAHEGNIKEEFLFCEPLLKTTKAIYIFEMVTSFFDNQNIQWKSKLSSICTDGAPAMWYPRRALQH